MDNLYTKLPNTKADLVDLIKIILPIFEAWKIPHFNTLRISDAYETDYDENYTPAVGAVILAQAIKNGMSYDHLYADYIKRASVLLITRGTKPFQQVFLLHYMCLSILILPDDKREWALALVNENLKIYHDTCQVLNTNCAALKLVNELLLAQLNIRPVDKQLIEKLLVYIETAQFDSGFINDHMEGEAGIDMHHLDGMPIAYHAFILFVLICGLFYVDFDKNTHLIRKKVEKIVNKGLKWMAYTETEDGSFAMAGRGKYHLFTRGIHSAIHAYQGDILKLDRSLQYWSSFLRPDGTYDVSLNHLPHHLRAGYESYTRVGMYNLLGMAAIAASLDFIKDPRPLKKSIFSIISNKHLYCDQSSGYAFYHKEKNFLAINLLKRSVSSQPLPMEAFHIRLNGMAIPLAEPYCDRSRTFEINCINDQLFEGYVYKTSAGDWKIPCFEKTEISVKADQEIILKSQDENCFATKSIHMVDSIFSVSYQVLPHNEISQILQTIPLCVTDGKNDLRINKVTDRTINLLFGNQNYQLLCPQAVTCTMLTDRSLKSVSGVSTRLQFLIDSKAITADNKYHWNWQLEYQGESSPELPIKDRLDYPDPLIHIQAVKLEYQKPARVGSKIRIITEAVGQDLEYAWYILERAKVGYDRIHAKWYQRENEFIWEPSQSGTFVVQPFIKDKEQHKVAIIWHEIITVE
ncbi:MAG: hypothetical protein JW908_02540 [Anaerolineales bacterium]|nr:hypothetical protein [Anaerolineales bacterium]